jgi:hypothetical protein
MEIGIVFSEDRAQQQKRLQTHKPQPSETKSNQFTKQPKEKSDKHQKQFST